MDDWFIFGLLGIPAVLLVIVGIESIVERIRGNK
jgi:hypothetical protein